MISGVLLDVFGTLVDLEPPAPRLAQTLGAPLEECELAFRDEIAYYRAHMLEAHDQSSLLTLHRHCAEVISTSLGRHVSVEQLLDALRFRAFPDAAPSLMQLRRAGLRMVVVSNWDISLSDVLRGAGLTPLIDGVVTSAACRVAKPDPLPFRAALPILGLRPAEVVHVGDSVSEDVAGARAAGITPILLLRGSAHAGAPVGAPLTVSSLTEVPGLVSRL